MREISSGSFINAQQLVNATRIQLVPHRNTQKSPNYTVRSKILVRLPIWSFLKIFRIISSWNIDVFKIAWLARLSHVSGSFYWAVLKILIFWPKIILKISKSDQFSKPDWNFWTRCITWYTDFFMRSKPSTRPVFQLWYSTFCLERLALREYTILLFRIYFRAGVRIRQHFSNLINIIHRTSTSFFTHFTAEITPATIFI